MIENYSLDKVNKFGSMQVALLNGRLIDSNSAFREIYDFGNEELSKLIEFNNFKDSSLTSLYRDYWVANKEILQRKYFAMCKNNSFIRFDEADTLEFVQDALYLALIDRIFNYSSKLKLAHDYSDFDSSELLYLISLFDISPYYIDESVEGNYNDFIIMLNTLKEDDASYELTEINEITNKGVIALEQFLIDMLNERIKLNKYRITYPYSIRVNESRFICASSNSLMGICFSKLALKISGYNLDHRYHQCKYYKCINYFSKASKRNEYCPECIANNIPNILKNKKYNDKR